MKSWNIVSEPVSRVTATADSRHEVTMNTDYETDVLIYNTVGPPTTLATTKEIGVGGSELEMVQVAHALARRGHRVTVALKSLNDDEAGEQEGVVYVPLKMAPKRVRALYLQR